MSEGFPQALEDIDDLQNELRGIIEEGESTLAFCELVRKLEIRLKPKVEAWKLQLNKLQNYSDAYRDNVAGGAALFASLVQSSTVTPGPRGQVDNTVDQMWGHSTVRPSVSPAAGSSKDVDIQIKNQPQSNQTLTAESTSTEILVPSKNVCEKSSTTPKRDGLDALIPEMANFFPTGVASVSHCSGNMDNGQDHGVVAECSGFDGTKRDQNAWLQIFPVEIWLKVLDNISDSNTLESVSNTSHFLRSILLPRRVQFLFPNVWNILGNKYFEEATKTSNVADQSYLEPQIYRNPLPWRRQGAQHQANQENGVSPTTWWFTGIIKLRMVCKTWCDAVDNWFQVRQHGYQITNEDAEQLPEDIIFWDINGFLEVWCPIWGMDRMDEFHSKFMATHVVNGVAERNPFFGRTIILNAASGRHVHQAREFWNRVKEIFLVYGAHIWYLTVNIEEGQLSRVDCYSIIRSLLQAAPNLRKLHLSYNPGLGAMYDVGNIFRQEDIIQLNHFIISHPLPRLDSLQFITTRPITFFAPFMPPPLFYELVRSNGHIEKLQIGHWFNNFPETNLSVFTAPNLREFLMAPCTQEECETFFGSNVGWKLFKLNLDLRNIFIEWDIVLREVGLKWGDTLTCLKLKLSTLESEEDQQRLLEQSSNFRLNLPRLTHLTLALGNLCCLDFLLPMRESLEIMELTVRASIRHTDTLNYLKTIENGKTIKFFSTTEHPDKSNIWQIFGRLRHLHFDCSLDNVLDVSQSFRRCITLERRLQN